jgi:uncharacterized protein YegP (UPF0339 family)
MCDRMSSKRNEGTLERLYSERFGEPLTSDEVYGYWLFVSSVIIGVIGVGLALASGSPNTTRLMGLALAGLGLSGMFTGLVIGQSFRQRAKYLVYLGVVLTVVAIAWFAVVYPGDWTWNFNALTTTSVILLYLLGFAIITMAGVMAPAVADQGQARREAEQELEETRRELEERERDLEERERERNEAQEEAETERARAEEAEIEAEAERARADEAEAHVDRLYDSNATFQLYEDKAQEWRWRLVHRNSNIVATSGEGYASDRNARRGMRSVKRNSLGANVIWDRTETEPEPEPEPVREESKASFELYRDADDEHRWRLRHDNGEIIAAAARGFSSGSSVRNSIDSVRVYIAPADYLEFDPAAFEVFEDAAGEFRWRLVHRNGNILGDSGEGYATRSNARRAIEGVQKTVEEADVGAESGTRFEVYEDAADETRWRLVSANDEIIADGGEGYSSRSEGNNAVERFQEYAPVADTLTVGDSAIEIYEDEGGDYRWRLRHRNGTIMATSGQGYSSRSGAVDGINSVKRNAPEAELEEFEDDDAGGEDADDAGGEDADDAGEAGE